MPGTRVSTFYRSSVAMGCYYPHWTAMETQAREGRACSSWHSATPLNSRVLGLWEPPVPCCTLALEKRGMAWPQSQICVDWMSGKVLSAWPQASESPGQVGTCLRPCCVLLPLLGLSSDRGLTAGI